MSKDPKAVSVTIMDKEYLVSCPEEERESLHEATEFLNEKMQAMRDNGKIIGTERIAVMTALNIVHDLLQNKKQNQDYNEDVGAGIKRMNEKIAMVLQKNRQLEL